MKLPINFKSAKYFTKHFTKYFTRHLRLAIFFVLLFAGCAELDKIIKEIEIKPIEPSTKQTQPKNQPAKKQNTAKILDLKTVIKNNAKERATKTTAQQKLISLHSLVITDTVVVTDVLAYRSSTSKDSCKNYLLFIEQTTETDLRAKARVSDNGNQCIYEEFFGSESKKTTHIKPTKRYKVFTQSSTKEEQANLATANNYALIFLSNLKPPASQSLNNYHRSFQNLPKGVKIKILAKIQNKKVSIATQSFAKKASNINIFDDNIFYLTVLSWQVVK